MFFFVAVFLFVQSTRCDVGSWGWKYFFPFLGGESHEMALGKVYSMAFRKR